MAAEARRGLIKLKRHRSPVDQLDPLVKRLKDAGVQTRDIAVVLGGGSLPPAVRPPEEAPLMPAWWNLLWPLAMCGACRGLTSPHADCERGISLAQYKARSGV